MQEPLSRMGLVSESGWDHRAHVSWCEARCLDQTPLEVPSWQMAYGKPEGLPLAPAPGQRQAQTHGRCTPAAAWTSLGEEADSSWHLLGQAVARGRSVKVRSSGTDVGNTKPPVGKGTA